MAVTHRVTVAVVLGMVFVASPSFAALETNKIGVVDSGKILQQLPETKQAESTLQATAATLQKEISLKNLELQNAVAEYKKKAPSLKPASRELREKELNIKGQALQKFQQEQNGVFEKKQQEVFAPIRQKVVATIESIAQKEGFSVVLEKNATVYFAPENDLTFKALDKLNSK